MHQFVKGTLLPAGGMTAPLYVHRPDSQSSTYLRTEASVENEWAMRMSENVASKVSTAPCCRHLLDLPQYVL